MNAARRFAAAGLALVLAGCGALRGSPSPEPPAEPVPLEATDPLLPTLVSGWENAAAERQALRGGARLSLAGPNGSQKLDQNVVVARPGRLRMEIQAFLVTAAVLVVDGNRYDYAEMVNDVRDAGPVYPGLLWDIAGVPLRLDQAIHFLLGAPPPRRGLSPAGGERRPDGSVAVDLHDAADRLARRLVFDVEGRLLGAEEFARNGELVWQVGYDRYKAVGEEAFAHRIEFEFPRYASRATVAFRSVELDPETPDAVFRLDGDGAAR